MQIDIKKEFLIKYSSTNGWRSYVLDYMYVLQDDYFNREKEDVFGRNKIEEKIRLLKKIVNFFDNIKYNNLPQRIEFHDTSVGTAEFILPIYAKSLFGDILLHHVKVLQNYYFTRKMDVEGFIKTCIAQKSAILDCDCITISN